VRNSSNAQQGLTVGVDLGDKYSHVCVLDAHGEIVEESRIATTREALERRFAGMAPAAMAIEAGTHSNWVYDLLTSLGHDVVVANPRKLRAITANERKSDQMDARMLARLRRADSQLLSPVVPRAEHMRRDLGVMRARAALVQARTMLVNHVRGVAKSSGSRLRKCSAESLHKAELPAELARCAGTAAAGLGATDRTGPRLRPAHREGCPRSRTRRRACCARSKAWGRSRPCASR
jgi:transposase